MRKKKWKKMFHTLYKVHMRACYAKRKINLACPKKEWGIVYMWSFSLVKKTIYSYYSKYESNFHTKYIWENWQTTGRFLSLKGNFYKNFSIWKVIIKWLFMANFRHDLQFQTQTEKSFFRTDILSKTGTVMKLTKNLVTVPSSLWTGYLIGSRYLGFHWHDHHHLSPSLCEHNNWITPIGLLLDSN